MAINSNNNYLLVALIVSLGVNIYGLFIDTAPAYCDNAGRFDPHPLFDGGREIETDSAKNYVEQYAVLHPDPETRGFTLSKLVFDNIFNDPTLNSVTIDLINTDDKTLIIIVKGAKVSKTEISREYTNSIFIAQTLCPIDCSKW